MTQQNISTESNPQIYVACLAAYNNGHLHGLWIDATEDILDIYAQINNMLSTSPIEDAEEYAIHDYEGFYGLSISEYAGVNYAHERAVFIQQFGALGVEVLNYYQDIESTTTALMEQYAGCYPSLADYAQDFTEESSDIPDCIKYYIDYEKMANDWEMSGDIVSFEMAHNEVHVFYSH